MKAIRRFTVRTVLPASLVVLEELATNVRWSWHEPTRQLFSRISPELWQQSGHDPIGLLGEVDPSRLDEAVSELMDEERRTVMGVAGRNFADQNFAGERVRARLRRVLDQAAGPQSSSGDC